MSNVQRRSFYIRELKRIGAYKVGMHRHGKAALELLYREALRESQPTPRTQTRENQLLNAVVEHIAPMLKLYEPNLPEHPVIQSIREYLTKP